MPRITYRRFDEINPESFIPVLNEESIRSHLIEHSQFDRENVAEWVNGKITTGASAGCRLRAVYANDVLVGWCGIQEDDGQYEIAIVISQSVWGLGTQIFQDLMAWAKELGHQEVLIHLLDSRPVYKALTRIALKTHPTTMLGRTFTTYHLAV